MRFEPARWKIAIWMGICAAIVGVGIWVITLGDEFTALLGLLVTILFAFPLLYFVVQFIHPLEWWELTPEGITSYALGRPVTTRWDDIEDIAFWPYGRLGQKRILIKTTSGKQQAQTDKNAARKADIQGGYHVMIQASQFSISAEDFYNLLHHYWQDKEAREKLKMQEAAPLA
jgi:hypothetical protein